MRLFTAIDLSDDARTAIASEQQRIRAGFADASHAPRFVRAEHLHLTLVFIGEIVDERRAADIIDIMRQDVSLSQFSLVFGGLGIFPPRRAPRVLWLGTLDGAREAIELQAAIGARLARAGVPPDSRPFRPHMTLARWRDARRVERPRLPEAARAIARVDVEAVTLYESRLSPAGPTYTAHARAHLRCP